MCSFNFLIADFKDMQMDSHKDQIGFFMCILAWEQLTLKNAWEMWWQVDAYFPGKKYKWDSILYFFSFTTGEGMM